MRNYEKVPGPCDYIIKRDIGNGPQHMIGKAAKNKVFKDFAPGP